jgi:cholestenol Delta-isomerase
MDFFRNSSPPVPVPAMPLHPYYPIGVAIPSYVANEMGTVELLSIFALGCLVILSILWFTLGKLSREIGFWDKMTILWFTLSV